MPTPQSVGDEKPESTVTGPCPSQICGEARFIWLNHAMEIREPESKQMVYASHRLWLVGYRSPLPSLCYFCVRIAYFLRSAYMICEESMALEWWRDPISISEHGAVIFGLALTGIDSDSSKRLNVPILLNCTWHRMKITTKSVVTSK